MRHARLSCCIPMTAISLQALVACAAQPGGAKTASSAETSIYSPPVRLGGRGSIIFIPQSSPAGAVMRQLPLPLEAPDPSPQSPTGEWLRGTWLLDATPDDLSRAACNSGTTMTYEADGTTSFFEGKGNWRLAGDMLTETLVEIHETGDPGDLVEIGTPFATRVKRVGLHEGAKLTEGKWRSMLRCRFGDLDVTP